MKLYTFYFKSGQSAQIHAESLTYKINASGGKDITLHDAAPHNGLIIVDPNSVEAIGWQGSR